MTAGVRVEFKKLNYTRSYIPGGCISFIQVLDIAFNKLLKVFVVQAVSGHTDKYWEKYKAGGFSVADRKVLLTFWVTIVWKEIHELYKKTIIKT
jgi:hypothetical protein